jgi:enoyl-CoA hydratase/carnithine racemase
MTGPGRHAAHPHLLVDRGPHGIRRILLARPERHNALTVELARALRDAFAEVPEDPVVLGSADPRVFCSGADMTISDAARAEVSAQLYECLKTMITRPGPVLAAVGGPAVAGGAQLATAADLRIAGPAARFRWVGPPGRGLAVGAWILPELVGRGRALELAFTGRWVNAAEAHALGLVNRVEAEPLSAAVELAADLAAHDAGSLARVKQIAAANGLLGRLRAEHEANQAAWAAALAAGPGQAGP